MTKPAMKLMVRGEVSADTPDWERVVMAEVLVPDVPNVFGDIYTREAIKEFAYAYAREGYGIDVDHDRVDILPARDAFVCESFIVRAGDPDFIEGSWVVAMKIEKDEIWQAILDGEINGYSFDALCEMTEVIVQNLRNRQVVGVTEPDPYDGHTHDYVVLLNVFNRPISGGTGVTNGHSHRIVSHTVTEPETGLFGKPHSHRFQVLVQDEPIGDHSDG